jgi:hypothetical protein
MAMHSFPLSRGSMDQVVREGGQRRAFGVAIRVLCG